MKSASGDQGDTITANFESGFLVHGEYGSDTLSKGDTEFLGRRHGGSSASTDACLVVIRGPMLGKRITLENAQFTIGRGPDSEFTISEASVSRRHCRLTRHGEVFWLEDLRSTNGTQLNGEPIDRAALSDGDQIRVGSSVLKFIAAGNIESDYHLELHENAQRDGLTGLFNRHHAMEVLNNEVRKRLKGLDSPLSLAIIDIDYFKQINDRLGHLGGDEALRQLAAILREAAVDDGIVLARIGGEEFVVLMPGEHPSSARTRLDALRERVAQSTFEVETHSESMTISAGLAAWEASMSNASDLLRAADRKLYDAKRQGRNRVC